MNIDGERSRYFRGDLRFGQHAVDRIADIPLMARDIAGDMVGIFQKNSNNFALVELADIHPGATRTHGRYYSRYSSHVMAFAANILEQYSKVVNTGTIGQVLGIYENKNDPTGNFLLSYIQSLDLLTRERFRITVVYEDNRIPPEDMRRQLKEFQDRYKAISSREDFMGYFSDYIRDIITARDIQFVRTIHGLSRDAEINHTLTRLFGFLGLSHKKGVTEGLDGGVRDAINFREVAHSYSQFRPTLAETIRLRLIYGEPPTEQQWTHYYNYFLSRR